MTRPAISNARGIEISIFYDQLKKLSVYLALLMIFSATGTNYANAQLGDLGPEISHISSYGDLTCMTAISGEVWCWGKNTNSSLGTGRENDNATPHKVYEISDSKKVEVGDQFACSLGGTGTIRCWGKNDLGQTGNASRDFKDVYFPEYAALANNNVDLSLGEKHGCALNSLGEVWCWGSNEFGQLGDVTRPNSSLVQTIAFTSIPRKIQLPARIKSIDSGSFHTCAISEDSFLYCWGANFVGQLGIGFISSSISAPSLVPALSEVDVLGIGYNSSCARSKGTFYCWGEGSDGQLGENESVDRLLPRTLTRVATLTIKGTATGVSLGDSLNRIIMGPRSACGLENKTGTSQLICWGNVSKFEPTAVIANSVSLGNLHGCLITTTKTVNCWGSQQYGQAGQGINSPSFVNSTIITGIPEWSNYVSTWQVTFKNEIAIISWSGAAQSKFSLYLEPFGLVCETSSFPTCEVGPLKSNTDYKGLLIARGSAPANSRFANINFSTGKLISVLDEKAVLEEKKRADQAAILESIRMDKAAEAMDAANAATDAALIAVDAADKANLAAQLARDAAQEAEKSLERLTEEVDGLLKELRERITILAKEVAKIAKKVRA